MKFILCLSLVAPLVVFGNIIPAKSKVNLQPFDTLVSAPQVSEDKIKCINDALKKIEEENPDLVWWFNKTKELEAIVNSKYKKCSAIGNEAAKWKCFLELEKFASIERKKLINSLPEDKKHVLVTLKEAIQKCIE